MRRNYQTIGASLGKAGKMAMGLGHGALAGATAAALAAGSFASGLKEKAVDVGSNVLNQNKTIPKEVVTMKKSTLIALFVALAAIAGVLGALYVYVLRRERELDEYEQLLFSEDFNDDIPMDLPEDDKE